MIVDGFMESLIGPRSPRNADTCGPQDPETVHDLAKQFAEACCLAVLNRPGF